MAIKQLNSCLFFWILGNQAKHDFNRSHLCLACATSCSKLHQIWMWFECWGIVKWFLATFDCVAAFSDFPLCSWADFEVSFTPGLQVRTLFVSGLPVDIKPRELYLLFRPFKVRQPHPSMQELEMDKEFKPKIKEKHHQRPNNCPISVKKKRISEYFAIHLKSLI